MSQRLKDITKKFKPLKMPNPSDAIHRDMIINKLKNMNRNDVLGLFEEFDRTRNKDDIHFEVEELGEYDGRKLVKVDDQKFYKSTGTSRGTHLKGIFLPYDEINRNALFETDRRIKKLEDKYLQGLLPIEQKLITYGRFITEENAIKSWYLSKLYGLDEGIKTRK